VAGPQVARPAEVPLDGVARMAGAAAAELGPAVAVLGPVVVAPEYPDPAALVAVAATALRAKAPAGPLTPLYLRRPDAVEPGPRKRVTPG
jgi:hypothetical protein